LQTTGEKNKKEITKKQQQVGNILRKLGMRENSQHLKSF